MNQTQLQTIQYAASKANALKVQQMINAVASVPSVREQFLARHGPMMAAAAAQSSAIAHGQRAMAAAAAKNAASAASASTARMTGVIESLQASFANSNTALASHSFNTSAISAVSQFSLNTGMLGETLRLIQSGGIDYEEVVEGLDIREPAEEAATEAVRGSGVDLPADHQLQLNQAAALIYVLAWFFIIFEVIPEWSAEWVAVSLALLNGDGAKVARNLAPTPKDADKH